MLTSVDEAFQRGTVQVKDAVEAKVKKHDELY